MRVLGWGLFGLILVILVFRWAGGPTGGAEEAPATTAAATAQVPAETFVDPDPSASSSPSWSPPTGSGPEWAPDASSIPTAATQAATSRAEAFMRAYARPATAAGERSWWGKVRPHLTSEAAETLQIGPQDVPFRRVTGAAVVSPGDGRDLVATVPTDVGSWSIVLAPSAGGRYLVAESPRQASAAAPTSGVTSGR